LSSSYSTALEGGSREFKGARRRLDDASRSKNGAKKWRREADGDVMEMEMEIDLGEKLESEEEEEEEEEEEGGR
jgi:hypothetical protein